MSLTPPRRYFSRMMELRRYCDVEKIEESQYEYYSNWYNIPIRELVAFPEFKGNYKWLAKQLVPPITEPQAKKSVELLLRLGLIKKKGKKYERVSRVIGTAPEVNSLAVVNFHRKMTLLAEASLDNIPKTERDNTASTVCISERSLQKIKKLIYDCRMNILSMASSDSEADRVYQINFQAFPVSIKNKGS